MHLRYGLWHIRIGVSKMKPIKLKPIKLREIVDEIEMQMDEYRKFLNRKTGEIVTVSN